MNLPVVCNHENLETNDNILALIPPELNLILVVVNISHHVNILPNISIYIRHCQWIHILKGFEEDALEWEKAQCTSRNCIHVFYIQCVYFFIEFVYLYIGQCQCNKI